MHPVIEELEGLVLDLDGVVYRGSSPVPGSGRAIETLRAVGKRLLFLTNNSTRDEKDVVAKLRRIGVETAETEILTSGRVTTDLLLQRGLEGSSLFVIGGRGLRTTLSGSGFRLLPPDEGGSADVVVIGSDPAFDYTAMRVAADAVRAGALFVATNDDPSFPTPTGLEPGAGAILAAVEVASGGTAEVVGKPHPPMMRAAAERLAPATTIGIVGDQPKTDLSGGRALGWTTILVLSGVTPPEDERSIDPPPDVVVPDLAALVSG